LDTLNNEQTVYSSIRKAAEQLDVIMELSVRLSKDLRKKELRYL
jgi:hypothetical protein